MSVLKTVKIDINWCSELPIFESEPFLSAVSDEYGWIGGVDESGRLRCILPYTIVYKMGIRLVRFRVETILVGESIDVDEERQFLIGCMEFLRSQGADIVIPATTNTIFRTYPYGAAAVQYGSYVIDLCQNEDTLWSSIGKTTRRHIRAAERSVVQIRNGPEYLGIAYTIIRDTLRRSRLPFMSYMSLKRYLLGLGANGMIMVAYSKDVVQSCVIYAFSKYCAYFVYGGSIAGQQQGSAKLIHWEAMRLFRSIGVKNYDFVGARIDPEVGSKQEALNSFKKHFGGLLRQGYMWKYLLRPAKSWVYSLGVRIIRGGDIVDHERRKLKHTKHVFDS